jgi:hypothetical protein
VGLIGTMSGIVSSIAHPSSSVDSKYQNFIEYKFYFLKALYYHIGIFL